LSDARRSARLALTDVRTAVRALRESSGPISLAALLDDLADGLSGPRLLVRASVTGSQDGYDSATLTALYRVAQEGLTNAVKHARAGRVSVLVSLGPEAAVLEVIDDGCGMPSPQAAAGLTAPWRAAPLVAGEATGVTCPAAGSVVVERPVAPAVGRRPVPAQPDRAAPATDRDDVTPGGAAVRAGYGLIGIRERVQALGGRLHVRSAPGAGTTLAVTVPRTGEKL
jgi:signal transduction histidine kinase